jgi:NADH-quinone oxidoreductase subunit J
VTLLPFLALSVVAIAFALLLVLNRNAVHGALCLVVNFAVVAVFFLMLGAEFIAVVQVAVYAGAIMVLFLFVLMLLNIQGQENGLEQKPRSQILIAAVLGILLLAEIGVLAPMAAGLGGAQASAVPADFGSPKLVGLTLFQDHLLAFEIAAFILLAAMMGAVVLAKRRLA